MEDFLFLPKQLPIYKHICMYVSCTPEMILLKLKIFKYAYHFIMTILDNVIYNLIKIFRNITSKYGK